MTLCKQDTVSELSSDSLVTFAHGWFLRESADLKRIVKWARRRGLSPLLFWSLERQGSEDSEALKSLMSPGIWNVLRNDYYSAIAQALIREQELKCLITVLEQAEASVVVLKRAALAYTVYPEAALRTMGDVDLLVHHKDVGRAQQVLQQLGYKRGLEPSERFAPFDAEFTGEMSLYHTVGGHSMVVELHWELFPVEWSRRASALDLEALWARAVPPQVGDSSALSLAPEDMLIHVCLHLTVDGFSYLRGYVDIAQIVEAGKVDWSVFVECARQSRICVACYFPLRCAKRSWGVDVPSDVLSALRPGLSRRWIGNWMTSRGTFREVSSERVWNYAAQLLTVDRVWDLARVLLWMLFPGPVWIRERCRLHSIEQAWVWTVVHLLVVLREGIRSVMALFAQVARRYESTAF
jgi:hypothetical protein